MTASIVATGPNNVACNHAATPARDEEPALVNVPWPNVHNVPARRFDRGLNGVANFANFGPRFRRESDYRESGAICDCRTGEIGLAGAPDRQAGHTRTACSTDCRGWGSLDALTSLFSWRQAPFL
jgi:hypothetical protein